jgi:hypothetical protein
MEGWTKILSRINPTNRESPTAAANDLNEHFFLPRMTGDISFETQFKLFVRELVDIPLCGCLKDYSDPVDVVEVSTANPPSFTNEKVKAGGDTAVSLDLQPLPLASSSRRVSLRDMGPMAAATVRSLDIKSQASNTHQPASTDGTAMAGATVQFLDFQPLFDESLLDRTDINSSFLILGERR